MSYLGKLVFALDINVQIWYNIICCETLAQSVEHTPFKRRVEGSSPSCLTRAFRNNGALFFYVISLLLTNFGKNDRIIIEQTMRQRERYSSRGKSEHHRAG